MGGLDGAVAVLYGTNARPVACGALRLVAPPEAKGGVAEEGAVVAIGLAAVGLAIALLALVCCVRVAWRRGARSHRFVALATDVELSSMCESPPPPSMAEQEGMEAVQQQQKEEEEEEGGQSKDEERLGVQSYKLGQEFAAAEAVVLRSIRKTRRPRSSSGSSIDSHDSNISNRSGSDDSNCSKPGSATRLVVQAAESDQLQHGRLSV
jgi:hypothetical protein